MLKKYNIIMVVDKDKKNVLMCMRRKDPFMGLYNFVGGKVEENEESLDAAYRELKEETGIQRKYIELNHLMDFKIYEKYQEQLEVYYGILDKDIDIKNQEEELYWMSIDSDFNELNKFAGLGNITFMINVLRDLKVI